MAVDLPCTCGGNDICIACFLRSMDAEEKALEELLKEKNAD